MVIDRRISGRPARAFNFELAACGRVSPERACTSVGTCRTGAPSARRGGSTGVGRAFDGAGNPARYDALWRVVACGVAGLRDRGPRWRPCSVGRTRWGIRAGYAAKTPRRCSKISTGGASASRPR